LGKKKVLEDRDALTTQLKQTVRKEDRCVFEIRAPLGTEAHQTAQRLMRALEVAGLKGELVPVVGSPNSGILIEASQECARIALSIQTAFGGIGMEAHLLIQNTRRPDMVVIHLGQKQKPNPDEFS
jgi:hypothetical protein